MKNAHITSPSSSYEADTKDPKDSVIRLKIDKPSNWDWQLTTSSNTIPVIQLIDKDGRLLVETAAGIAQRAKGSFREGLKTHEEFPDSKIKLLGNRNFEGYSTKFESHHFGKPRKSRSDIDVRNGGKKSRKRNSSIEISRSSEGNNKKYSPGDYLRQQILDDLRTNSTEGKTPNEIAQVRCEKVRVYLRNKSDSLLNEIHHSSRERSRNNSKRRVDRSTSNSRRRSLQNEGSLYFDGEMVSEKCSNIRRDASNSRRNFSNRRDTSNGRKDSSSRRSNTPNGIGEISNEIIDLPTDKTTGDDISSESMETDIPKVPFPQTTVNSFKTGKQLTKHELEKIRGFLQDRISAKMTEEKLSRSRSQPIGMNNFPDTEIESEKRYSDYSPNRKNYHIRKVGSDASVVRFKERQLQPSGSRHNLEDSSILRRKLRSRTRTDALLEADELENIYRERKPVVKQKVYTRKTRSDTLLGNLDSKYHLQDNLERTWREYKDRKKIDSKLDKLDTSDMEEEDFMKKPRWKDLKFENCSLRNCLICENLKNCINPLASKIQENINHSKLKQEILKQNGQLSPDINSRPKTALQENYLVLDRVTSPQHDSIISETTTNSREEEISSSSWNSPDFGYNSIPKQSRDYKEILSSSSAVKKSDTFKVVDGSENPTIIDEEKFPMKNGISLKFNNELSNDIDKQNLNRQTNQEIAEDYFLRVYELLKKRKEEVRQLAQLCNDSERELEETEIMKPRRRRRQKMGDSPQGENIK